MALTGSRKAVESVCTSLRQSHSHQCLVSPLTHIPPLCLCNNVLPFVVLVMAQVAQTVCYSCAHTMNFQRITMHKALRSLMSLRLYCKSACTTQHLWFTYHQGVHKLWNLLTNTCCIIPTWRAICKMVITGSQLVYSLSPCTL